MRQYHDDHMRLAYAYVPYQSNRPQIWSPMEAIRRGTAFPELFDPYMGYPRW